MIARITRLLLLLQVLAGAGIFFLLTVGLQFANPAMALALSLGAILALRMIITGNNFLLAQRYRSALPEDYRIDVWQTAKLFACEFRATMTASSWTMPFHAFSRRTAAHPEGLPVLLIHGYGCNSGYWHAMSKALLEANITHHAIDMEPVIGSIDEYARQIHQAVERLCNETRQDKIVIVAHSMGGLATRAYLRDHGSGRVARVITLGTPHHGTALAHFGVGINTHQMRWTAAEQEGIASEWLRQLAAVEDEATYQLFVSIYSHHDNIISPQTSSHLQGAENIEFHAIGHVALAFNPAIQAQVIREIRKASQRTAVIAT
jgi:triacylglycerol lipase